MAPRKSFLLRLPPELLNELNRWASDELRSVNGQIEYILREAVRKRGGKIGEEEQVERETEEGSPNEEPNGT